MSDNELDAEDAVLPPQVKALKIHTNLRKLYGGGNRSKLPVLAGKQYDPSDRTPVQFDAGGPRDIRGNRCTLKFSPWVDADRFLTDIGYNRNESHIWQGDSYNLNTTELGRALSKKAEASKAL